MNPKQQTSPQASTITFHEAYHILYRHKLLIAVLVALSVLGGVALRLFMPLPYTSEAALMIRYIREAKPPVQAAPDTAMVNFNSREENVINSELGILTSYDLATNVVGILTPAKILAKEGGGTNKILAAQLIRKHLVAEVAPRSDLIELSYSHSDPEMATLILNQIIEAYLRLHNEIHRPEFNEFLNRVTEDLKAKLRDTDKELLEAKKRANVVQLDEGQRQIVNTLSKLQQNIYDAQAEWAGLQQTIRELEFLIPKSNPSATNEAAEGDAKPVPADVVTAYKRVRDQLDSLEADQQKLLAVYTTNSPMVQPTEALIAKAAANKKDMETKYPALLSMTAIIPKAASLSASVTADPQTALNDEKIKADALQARIRMLTNEMAETRRNADNVTAMESTLVELQRQRDQQESALDWYLKKLEESSTDQVLEENNSNISKLQSPTPAVRDESKLNKWMVELMAAGFVFALALPFFIELVLDRSLKHPSDVKTKLSPLPFFITIPQLNGNGRRGALRDAKIPGLLGKASVEGNGHDETAPVEPAPGNGHLALWEDRHDLQPFYETLRDRLMTFFEMINLTHKPKLVAVTSCHEGAGVTTTAAGLASSLSETGDGNVLLVNMNGASGAAHHFYRGKLTCGLEEILEKGKSADSVASNLYVAREKPEDDRLPRVLPKRFSHLLPKMKASDFDYIIFDMPPVSQISITPRLARFMDMVLLVIESGKTDRDMAKRVATLLSDSKANVGVVLNKNQNKLPGNQTNDI
jgi:uncharacterized protein involved in exopolysaccharide biosynthesis/Mrp family chromosome partitioning ATPase